MLNITHKIPSEQGVCFAQPLKANPSLPLKASKSMLTKDLPADMEARSSLLLETRALIFFPINTITRYALFSFVFCSIEHFFSFFPSMSHFRQSSSHSDTCRIYLSELFSQTGRTPLAEKLRDLRIWFSSEIFHSKKYSAPEQEMFTIS